MLPVAAPILVTGAAGFIGFHVTRRLLREGVSVVGLDSFTPYYDVQLKEARWAELEREPAFAGYRLDLVDAEGLNTIFKTHGIRLAIHLAAQPGVRYALDHPVAYGHANLDAFLNILEAARHCGLAHLLYASSSSVYGANTKLPFAESDPVDHPVSLYAATKRANELMAHSYAHLFDLPVTGLRFFTVYGPWGRPDMAIYTFTDRIARGLPIEVAADGEVRRDFTFVDDVVEAILRLLPGPADAPWNRIESASELLPSPELSAAPFRIFNIGGEQPVDLNSVIRLIETAVGRPAIRHAMPLPPGDIAVTQADPRALRAAIGIVPTTPLSVGIPRFVEWYRRYDPIRSA